MKLSIYNTYLTVYPHIGCIYNALTDKTVVFRGDAKNIERFNTVPDEIRDKFMECGILVDDSADEYTEFINQSRAMEDSDDNYHLLINPTLNCNFHCSYCYESHFNSRMDSETFARVKKLIVKRLSEGRDLVISFFGGEPMLYYEDIMKPLIEFSEQQAVAYGRKFSCNMTSNGYLLDEERVKWLSRHSFTHAQITLDGSREVHNRIRYRFIGDNTYDRIVDNVRLLVRYGIGVTLRLNCTHANIRSLSDIAPSLDDLPEQEKRRIMVDIHIVWQERDKHVLFDNMDTVAASFADKGIPAARMNFRGFCYADRRDSCLVNFNGDVYKCTAKDFSTVPRDGFINEAGEVVWENDSLNRRMQSKFRNPHCRDCRIFPLCHGGCSTNSLENGDYCLHGFSDEEKDRVVKGRIVYNSASNAL